MINDDSILLVETNDATIDNNLHQLGQRFFKTPSTDQSQAILHVSGSPYPPQVDMGDIVKVDFLQNRLINEGFYVITLDSEWIGIRMFSKKGRDWYLHNWNSPEAQLVNEDIEATMTIVGKVEAVYKPTKH